MARLRPILCPAAKETTEVKAVTAQTVSTILVPQLTDPRQLATFWFCRLFGAYIVEYIFLPP
jgi:hypothetical protein